MQSPEQEPHNHSHSDHNQLPPSPLKDSGIAYKAQWKMYAVITVIIIVVLLIANTAPTSDTTDTPPTSTENERQTVVVDNNELVHGYALGAFEQAEQASDIINSSQGNPLEGDGAEIPLSWIVNSDQENMVFFATESYNKKENTVFVGVYHFNTSSSRWQRIYKTEYSANEGDIASHLRVIGRANNQLIVQKEPRDATIGICYSPWLSPGEKFVLSIENPYSQFSTFNAPKELIEQESQKTEKCLKEFSQ